MNTEACDLIYNIKLFNGDLYGETVRDIIRTVTPTKIYARIDPNLEVFLLRIISPKYSIEPLSDTAIYKSYKVNKNIELHIVTCKRFDFRNIYIDFDCNLLCENDTSIYMKYTPANFIYLCDKLTYIRSRIMLFQFALAIKEINVNLINNAVKLCEEGWKMDDFILQNKSWLVNKWVNYISGCRLTYTNDQSEQLLSRNECCLCHEKFKSNDIVFNTQCNHNFHWNCNGNNGLCIWFKTITNCPICRTNLAII